MDENDDLTSLVAGLSELGGYEEQLTDLDKQIARAQKLREARMPGGIQAGRVFVADNPLSMIGSLGQNWAGRKMENEAQAGKTKTLGQQSASRKALMDAFLRKSGRNVDTPQDVLSPEEEMYAQMYGGGG